MTTTDRIITHWKAITARPDVDQHEAGFRRVIDAAIADAKRTYDTAGFIEPIVWKHVSGSNEVTIAPFVKELP